MRRIRPRFASLEVAFAALGLKHPDYIAILIGVMDELPADYLKRVRNSDDYFQVTVGFDQSLELSVECDQRLAEALFRQLSQAILKCPFTPTDRRAVGDMLDAWERDHLASGGCADAEPGAAPDRRGMTAFPDV